MRGKANKLKKLKPRGRENRPQVLRFHVDDQMNFTDKFKIKIIQKGSTLCISTKVKEVVVETDGTVKVEFQMIDPYLEMLRTRFL